LKVERKVNKLYLSPEAALEKMRNWCAYQERSQSETLKKIRSFGVSQENAEQILSSLITENFVNEERFARAFAGGKFRMKRWGRNKIRMELKKHQVSDYSIKKALEALGDEEYERAAGILIEKKLNTILSTDRRKKYYSTLNYLVSRGFESDLVISRLNQLLGEQNNYEFRT
jgi:regulatory protein